LGSPSSWLDAIIVAALVAVATIPLFGWLSDIYGRRMLYLAGTLFTMGFAFPLFWLLDTKNPDIIILTMVVALSLGQGTMFGLQSTYFPELFGTACATPAPRSDSSLRPRSAAG
jgi:MFS transporter, MHS family, shikimate and dehydroshikimate transport protein